LLIDACHVVRPQAYSMDGIALSGGENTFSYHAFFDSLPCLPWLTY
jgi:hypothetical protein